VVVTAKNTRDLLSRFRHVHELSWGESVAVSTAHGQVSVTSVEVAHWGARMIRDEQREYGGYLIEREGRTICFAGDTALTPAFAHVRTLTPALDLILMPIGAYDPWIHSHCSPEQAGAMARDAGARHFVPIHHETFRLSAEPMDEPLRRLEQALSGRPGVLLARHVGETFRVPLDD
jgi:L-ascorbate metabolism protein UlaG (beta-lactamase superfamily)